MKFPAKPQESAPAYFYEPHQSVSSATRYLQDPQFGSQRAGLGHVRPHDLRHTFITRLLDLSVPIEQVNYLAGHKTMAMTKRYDHANEERYGGAIEALDEAGKTDGAETLAAARWKET